MGIEIVCPPIRRVYEDPQIIVLDKPAGLVTMPGPAHEKYEETLAGWLLSHVGSSLKNVGLEGRWGIVHRLDKDTSGLLICGKTQKAFEYLISQFKKKGVKKKYLALVWGRIEKCKMKNEKIKINTPIARNPKNRLRFCAREEGKEAVTEFRVLGTRMLGTRTLGLDANILDANFSFVEAYPLTGRTHQIRVHLKHIGHPIVGDYFYSGRKRFRFAKNVLGLQRQFLHASGLCFKLLDGTVAEFTSELPEDLKNCLAQFTSL
ncbi:MAG: RluA family pseudouridine synthase [Candidatus Cloacimonetes bacterium]|nr:RluA family pseudouridine synthase [Candidatus Cloacimonadota bacterium]